MSEHIIETEISNGALFIPYQSKLSEAVREEIVRCRDCAWCTNSSEYGAYCTHFGSPLYDDYNGYCAWADKRWKDGGDD